MMRIRFLILFFVLFGAIAIAQKKNLPADKVMNDPNAGKILKDLKHKITALKSFKIDFLFHIYDGDSKKKESIPGSYTVKGVKFILITKNHEIYNNGMDVWTYLALNKELQISKNNGKNTITSPISMLENYEKEYYYQFKPNETPSKDQVIIELIPTNKKKSIFKIDLVIDKKKNKILYSKIYEKSGIRQEFTISQFIENPLIDDATFATDKSKYPKDVEVIDLR